MNLNEYQKETANTAIYPYAGTGDILEFSYLALGLTGEAGEVAEKIKKYIRDGKIDHDLIIKEIGDVYWYLARLCTAFGVEAETVLAINNAKLADRKARGVLGGSGDKR